MSYIKITDYNSNDKPRQASLGYATQSPAEYSQVFVQRFEINSKTFPCFIPKLVATPDVLRIPSLPSIEALPNTDYYNTEFSVAMYNTETGKLASRAVKWIPVKNFHLRPMDLPPREQVLNNPYFHCWNSIQLLDLINTTLNGCCAALGIEENTFIMLKTNGEFKIIQKSPSVAKVFFNTALQHAFNFFYTQTFQISKGDLDDRFSELQFNKNNIEVYEDGEYLYTSTLSLTTRIFPYSEVQFTSSLLGINPISVSTTAQTLSEDQNILFSYALQVEDPDGPCDNFSYDATSNFRPSMLGSILSSFDIQMLWKTPDNYSVPVMIGKGDFVSILLQFD